MPKHTLEERIRRLEILFERSRKNELLGLFDKPNKTDEAKWVNKLFTKYSSFKDVFDEYKQDDKSNKSKPFHLALHTKDNNYNGIWFLISTTKGRDDMYCNALDKNNRIIGSVKNFNIDADINNVAKFILQTLKENKNPTAHESRRRKYENVLINPFDCETLEAIIEDNLDDLPEVDVEVTDDNGVHGFANVGIYNPEFIIDYDVMAIDYNSFEISINNNKIGKAKSLEDVGQIISDHFMDHYI
jgi:hypothetical protein